MKLNLSAPLYPPAVAYHPPVPAPFEFGVKSLTIAELMECDATQKIIQQYAGWAAGMYKSEPFSPHRQNFTLLDMANFIPMDLSKSIAAVDAALRELPRSEWPRDVQ